MEDFVSKRLNELRLIEEQSCLEIENLQNKQKLMNDFIIIKQLESEKKVLVRKLNDAKIRIRNLERNNMNRSRTRTLDTSLISTISEMKTCDSIVNDEPACDKEIDFEDEYFDPELLDLERVRPTPRLCPHYPLPHSMVPVSSRYIKRVGLWRDSNVNGLNSTLIDSIGQFTSVEDEKIDWSQMSIFGDRVNSGRSRHSYGRYNYKKYQGYKQHFEESSINETPTIVCKAYSIKQQDADTFKPVVEKVVKKNIVNVIRRMSESSEDCVCQRKASDVACTGPDCDYSFRGRLAKSCSVHPGDKYLMDHSGICPSCGAQLEEARTIISTQINGTYKQNVSQTDSHLKKSLITVTPVLKSRKK